MPSAARCWELARDIIAAARCPSYSSTKHWFIVDGKYHDLKHREPVRGTAAFAPALNQLRLETLGRRLDVEQLGLKILAASDLTPLRSLRRLKGLWIDNAPRLADLSPLAQLPTLEVLHVEDCNNLQDYGPLADSALRAVRIDGGMRKSHRINSVEPFACMRVLKELDLDGIGIAEGGLRPLTASRSLRSLGMPYGLPLTEYAVMKALRPDLVGDDFTLFRHVEPFDGKDLICVARTKSRRRSFSSEADAAKVAAITEEFDVLVRDERRSRGRG